MESAVIVVTLSPPNCDGVEDGSNRCAGSGPVRRFSRVFTGMVLRRRYTLIRRSSYCGDQDPLRYSVSATSTLRRRASLTAGQLFSQRTSVFQE